MDGALMGGPFYVTEAAMIFNAADAKTVAAVEELFRNGGIAYEFELGDTGFSVDDPESEHGFCDIGYGFKAFAEDDDPPGTMRILFTYDSLKPHEGREERVAAAVQKVFPDIEARAEFRSETW